MIWPKVVADAVSVAVAVRSFCDNFVGIHVAMMALI